MASAAATASCSVTENFRMTVRYMGRSNSTSVSTRLGELSPFNTLPPRRNRDHDARLRTRRSPEEPLCARFGGDFVTGRGVSPATPALSSTSRAKAIPVKPSATIW